LRRRSVVGTIRCSSGDVRFKKKCEVATGLRYFRSAHENGRLPSRSSGLKRADFVAKVGQKAKFRDDQRMSALASKADISRFMSTPWFATAIVAWLMGLSSLPVPREIGDLRWYVNHHDQRAVRN
jgi:hypothetical protein